MVRPASPATSAPAATLLGPTAAVAADAPRTLRRDPNDPTAEVALRLAEETGQRYGVDPAILAAVTRVRPEVILALAGDQPDLAATLDATARYLVVATRQLGDVASAVAALEVGAGTASTAVWPDDLGASVRATLDDADTRRAPVAADAAPVVVVARPRHFTALVGGSRVRISAF